MRASWRTVAADRIPESDAESPIAQGNDLALVRHDHISSDDQGHSARPEHTLQPLAKLTVALQATMTRRMNSAAVWNMAPI